MQTRHGNIHDELVAILGASRELTADSDPELADAFLRYLEREQNGGKPRPEEIPRQPHYSLKLAGAAWGATLMFLFLLLLLDRPSAADFVFFSVLLLSLVAAITRGFLYLARSGWKVPHVRVTVAVSDKNVRRG